MYLLALACNYCVAALPPWLTSVKKIESQNIKKNDRPWPAGLRQVATNIAGLAVVVVTATILSSVPADARLYKWVDESGNVSYQDSPPPSNHSDATAVLNSQGVTMERIPGVEEQKRMDAEKATIARARQRDKALIDAFPSEADLLRTRDKRLGLIDDMITRMHDQLVILNTRLATIESKIDGRSQQGLQPSATLDSDRVAVMRGIDSTNALIRSKLNERRQISKKFGADLERYRELATTSARYEH